MKSRLALLILTILAAAVAPVLINPGFEESWWSETTYWTPEGGPFHDQFVEITPPEEWTAWWHELDPCAGTEEHLNRRPEVRVISRTPDPTRVHSGDKAVKFFTFWGCHRGGLYQQVTVEPGKHYTVQASVHTWFSDCDLRPHYHLPLKKNCETPILWAHDWLRVCIDPLGGIDPTASSVVCSPWEQRYGSYGDPLVLRYVEAISSTATVILESIATHPLKHDDVYWDDVTLTDSTYRIFVPYIVREG